MRERAIEARAGRAAPPDHSRGLAYLAREIVERIRSGLQAAGDEIREFLEHAYVPEEPGRFRLSLAGATPAGSRVGLTPSCLALRIARGLDLWDRVDKDEQAAWLAFISAYQTTELLAGGLGVDVLPGAGHNPPDALERGLRFVFASRDGPGGT